MYEFNETKRTFTILTLKKIFLPNWKGGWGENLRKAIKEEKRKTSREMRDKSIINLSEKNLSEQELDIINRGLKFIISPQKTKNTEYLAEMERFKRRLRLKIFFAENTEDKRPNKKPPRMTKQSNWSPPETKNRKLIRFFKIIDIKTKEILNKRKNPQNSNMNVAERERLKFLKNQNNITFKQIDKGGGVCIMDTEKYRLKITNLLEDQTAYRPIPHDPTAHIVNEVNDLVDYMRHKHTVNEKTAELLRSHNPCRCPLFYGLPKTHKEGIPLRPIVSGCNGPTDNLSHFITGYLQPLAELLPSYFRDSTEFIRMLSESEVPTEDYWLVTADVTSLYTNIPHEEGIDAITHYLTLYKNYKYPTEIDPIPPISHITRIVRTILENSAFKFGNTYHHQVSGTSMGTRMAPPYANLFMGRLDETISNKFPDEIKNYKRFIDDIFFTFHGTEEELNKVKKFMNNIHSTIKFTFKTSKSTISFMDLELHKNEHGGLISKLYKKPTDTNNLLHFKSNHPRHQKEGLIFGQALRLNRLVSNNKDLEDELTNLAKRLITKGYPLNTINLMINKALRKKQKDLVSKKNNTIDNNNNFTPIIMPNDQTGSELGEMILKHWKIIEKDTDLNKIFPKKPRKVFKNKKSIKTHIISTKLKEENEINDDELIDILIELANV
jgi:hypothetical protein